MLAEVQQSLAQVIEVAQQYALQLLLIFIIEMVIAAVLVRLIRGMMGAKGTIAGTLVLSVMVPLVHHLSHVLPCSGHIISAAVLAIIIGSVFKRKAAPDKGIGFLAGLFLFVVRIVFHYVMVLVLVFIIARDLFNAIANLGGG